MSGGGWDLEEIRRRADIVEIISPHVRLRKSGRRLSGLCPFHQERSPSFTVDPEKGLWHCFGCKAGGDLFSFVELTEKVTFQEAVELLARRLGLPPRTPADAARTRARDRLLSMHEEAAHFFAAGLKRGTGKRALAYLKRRGVSEESIEGFGLGYAPDAWDGLLQALGKRGFAGADLARAGLVLARNDGGFYDRFRNRLIFPIRDASGRAVAFGGRALAEDQQPKYLNSPETPLFQKGQVLYGFDRARSAIAESGRAIVVEGYLDVIACHEAGFAETVATMGTALTSQHVDVLRRRTERLVLGFDSDSAGLAAALRGRELFARAGLDVRVITMPEGRDPDDVIRDRGAPAFGELVEAALPMIEWELSRVLARADGRGEREMMEAVRDAVSVLARVPGGVEREHYVTWLARRAASGSPDRLRNMESAVREELARRAARAPRPARTTAPAARQVAPAERQSAGKPAASRLPDSLLAGVLQHGEYAGGVISELGAEDFPEPEQREVFEAIVRLGERGEAITPQSVLGEVEAAAKGLLARLALEEVPHDRVEEFLASSVGRLVEARLGRQQRQLQERLSEAASDEEREAIRKELTEVARRRSELAGQRIVGRG